MAKFSTGLRIGAMHTSSVLDLLNSASLCLRIFGGSTVPETADAAEAGPLLMTLEVGSPGTGFLQLEPLAGTASIVRETDQVWRCDSIPAAGTLRYFRLCGTSDSGEASTSDIRIQGTVSTLPGADLVVTDAVVVAGAPWVLNYFRLTLPTA